MTTPSNSVDAIPVAAVVLAPGEGRQIPPGDDPFVTIKVERRQSGGTMTAYEATVGPRRTGPPVHVHQAWDEAFYVIAGEMTFLIGEETHTLSAGSFVFVPGGVLHTFWNEGTEVARQLTILTPSGIEDLFDKLVPLLAKGVVETTAERKALNARYGVIESPGDRTPFTPLDEQGSG